MKATVREPYTQQVLVTIGLVVFQYIPFLESKAQRPEISRDRAIPASSFNDRIIPGGTREEWTRRDTLQGTLILETGSTLTIHGEVLFFPGSKIIIKPGSRLILEGARLTSLNGRSWGGIEVWGRGDRSQQITEGRSVQGILETHPGSVIENAETGVRVGHPLHNHWSGGILKAQGTVFRNNRHSVVFSSYHSPLSPGGNPEPNAGSIADCRFDFSDEAPFDLSLQAFILLWDIEGLMIRGCSFANTSRDCRNTDRGTGVWSENAVFWMGSGSLENTFQGLRIGIRLQSDLRKTGQCLEACRFDGNETGISACGIDSLVIRHNEIRLDDDLPTGIVVTGIELSACRCVTIHDNLISRSGDTEKVLAGIGILALFPYGYRESTGTIIDNACSNLPIVYQEEWRSADNRSLLGCAWKEDPGNYPLARVTESSTPLTLFCDAANSGLHRSERFFTLLDKTERQGKGINQLNFREVRVLEQLAVSGSDLIALWARNILNFFYGYDFRESPLIVPAERSGFSFPLSHACAFPILPD